MKKITKTLFVLIMIVSLLSTFCACAFAEYGELAEMNGNITETTEDGNTGEEMNTDEEANIDEEVTVPTDNNETDESNNTEDTVQNDAASDSNSNKTVSNISLTAPSQTLKVGEAFGTTYSYSTGNLVIAYDYVLLDKNGNKTEGKDAGTYTITIQNVRVYDISNDPGMSQDISGNYHITTTNGTLTRTASAVNGSNASSANGTYYSGSTSSTTSVKTGDENNIGLWVAVAVIALAGVSAVSVAMIRRRVSK